MGRRTRIPAEIKDQILRRIKEEGISAAQAAKEHGVSAPTVYSWLSANAEIPSNILQINKLKRENSELKMLVSGMLFLLFSSNVVFGNVIEEGYRKVGACVKFVNLDEHPEYVFIWDLPAVGGGEEIIEKEIKGESVYKIKREVKKLVENRGFTALIDRGGKRWKVDRYAEMLVRTHIIKANNSGFVNRLLENGLELVEMSHHASACPICQPYEGKLFTLTGKNKKYGKAPDLPIHPNCKHSFLPFIE